MGFEMGMMNSLGMRWQESVRVESKKVGVR